ncbi:extracellular solute-binding protein [Lentilitoribacter sp. Alg239-R112]|uniref:extracellular solute-binding protein n=1 Tax=Lentilitoribacter sp. Alg239-R112 TaxID=2305987 RepID=UPI0013A6D798|nr:extracellular solute-binding protein [Lentilitoribacter sp. Alg239-R112]
MIKSLFSTCIFALALTANTTLAEPLHGISMHGEPALPADYKHFPYANPDAPKGGKISYGVVGTFDSLNPFILKSMRTAARGIIDPEFGHLYYDTLMQRSRDEAFTMYGLLAETVEWDDERTFLQFNLNPKARWHDGKPVTADDIIFTFETMTEKGRPPYSRRLARVERMEKVSDLSVKFIFNEKSNREFPLILGLMPIIPKHDTDAANFDSITMDIPVGSGPYKVKEIRPGERITYERDPNYWAKDIPSKVGFDNYDEIRVEYFLSQTAQFEAFKKGLFDVYPEGNPTHWQTAYNFSAVNDGEIIKQTFKKQRPSGMYGFVFNTRRDIFKDIKVRKALSLMFDFEWINKNLYGGVYTRTQSFWQGSDLSSYQNPANDIEKALLAPFPDAVSQDIMDGTYQLPVTDASGRDRKLLRQALGLFQEAGYKIDGGKLIGTDGKQLTFEVMPQNEDQEKLALAYQRSLKALGIEMSVRTVDDAQYQKRSQTYDFDMIIKAFTSSFSPGGEQVWRWSSRAVEPEGTFNFAGVASPAVDAMIDALVNARTTEDFQAAVRAYDRTLLSGHYIIPAYHLGETWVAHRDYIKFPEGKQPIYGYQLPVWWDGRAE